MTRHGSTETRLTGDLPFVVAPESRWVVSLPPSVWSSRLLSRRPDGWRSWRARPAASAYCPLLTSFRRAEDDTLELWVPVRRSPERAPVGKDD